MFEFADVSNLASFHMKNRLLLELADERQTQVILDSEMILEDFIITGWQIPRDDRSPVVLLLNLITKQHIDRGSGVSDDVFPARCLYRSGEQWSCL